MCSIDSILTQFEEKDVSALLIVTSMMSAASVVISIATFIVTIVNLKGSHPQLTSVEVQNSDAAEVHLEEAHVEEAEDTHSEDVESDHSQAIEPQEQLYRLSVPSGNEPGLSANAGSSYRGWHSTRGSTSTTLWSDQDPNDVHCFP